MNQDKPPAYSESGGSNLPYQTLTNEGFEPCSLPPRSPPQPVQNVYSPNNPYPPVNPYGNMPVTPNHFVFTTIQQPAPAAPATTVNVNTGPIQKRYCCSCCCTIFWIFIVLLIISALLHAIQG